MLLYSSLRVHYNQNKYKDLTIRNLVTFFKWPTFLTAQGNVRLQPAHHHNFHCLTVTTRPNLLTQSSLNLCQIKEFYADSMNSLTVVGTWTWNPNIGLLEFAALCCWRSAFIIFFSNLRPDNHPKIIVQHECLDNRRSLLKNFWNKYAKLENLTAADQNGPACHRRHDDVGAGL